MAIIWLITAILGIGASSTSVYFLNKQGSPGGATSYVFAGVNLLLSVVLLYASVVEGMPLAYALIACGIVHVVTGIYYLIVPPTLLKSSDGKSTPSALGYATSGLGILIGLVLAYWGYQRYTAATLMPVMLGGRRRRR